jgi:hypothetical protein
LQSIQAGDPNAREPNVAVFLESVATLVTWTANGPDHKNVKMSASSVASWRIPNQDVTARNVAKSRWTENVPLRMNAKFKPTKLASRNQLQLVPSRSTLQTVTERDVVFQMDSTRTSCVNGLELQPVKLLLQRKIAEWSELVNTMVLVIKNVVANQSMVLWNAHSLVKSSVCINISRDVPPKSRQTTVQRLYAVTTWEETTNWRNSVADTNVTSAKRQFTKNPRLSEQRPIASENVLVLTPKRVNPSLDSHVFSPKRSVAKMSQIFNASTSLFMDVVKNNVASTKNREMVRPTSTDASLLQNVFARDQLMNPPNVVVNLSKMDVRFAFVARSPKEKIHVLNQRNSVNVFAWQDAPLFKQRRNAAVLVAAPSRNVVTNKLFKNVKWEDVNVAQILLQHHANKLQLTSTRNNQFVKELVVALLESPVRNPSPFNVNGKENANANQLHLTNALWRRRERAPPRHAAITNVLERMSPRTDALPTPPAKKNVPSSVLVNKPSQDASVKDAPRCANLQERSIASGKVRNFVTQLSKHAKHVTHKQDAREPTVVLSPRRELTFPKFVWKAKKFAHHLLIQLQEWLVQRRIAVKKKHVCTKRLVRMSNSSDVLWDKNIALQDTSRSANVFQFTRDLNMWTARDVDVVPIKHLVTK